MKHALDLSATVSKPRRSRDPDLPDPGLERDALLGLFRSMLVIRLTEEELARCHQRGLIHGACHTYVGQEAIAAGVCGRWACSTGGFGCVGFGRMW